MHHFSILKEKKVKIMFYWLLSLWWCMWFESWLSRTWWMSVQWHFTLLKVFMPELPHVWFHTAPSPLKGLCHHSVTWKQLICQCFSPILKKKKSFSLYTISRKAENREGTRKMCLHFTNLAQTQMLWLRAAQHNRSLSVANQKLQVFVQCNKGPKIPKEKPLCLCAAFDYFITCDAYQQCV